MIRTAFAAAMLLGLAGAALADPSPYAGLEQRRIKALSDAEVDDLLAGRGLGMALAAELNRYPGPVHVLELAAPLALSAEQAAETRRLLERMRGEAVPLGAAIVDREAELDRLFASALADEAALAALVREIARLRGELRLVHLQYHLAMRRLLRPEQLAAYGAARGYAAGHGSPDHHPPAHGG
jgi:Spy/CpxP family protein refolding chaperone